MYISQQVVETDLSGGSSPKKLNGKIVDCVVISREMEKMAKNEGAAWQIKGQLVICNDLKAPLETVSF